MGILTTDTLIRSYLPSSVPASDGPVISKLGNVASASFEAYTDRHILAADYTEDFAGFDDYTFHTQQFPIITVYRLQFMRTPAMSLTYTASNPFASVDVTETDITLKRIVAGATSTDATFSFADYPTFTLLAAAVNGVSGWSAEALSNYGNWPTSEIVEPGTRSAAGSLAYLEVYSQDLPYRVQGDTGEIYSPFGFLRGYYKRYRIKYRAGYECVPDDVAGCVAEMAALLYQQRGINPNLASESLGQYSYSNVTTRNWELLSPISRSVLMQYRNPQQVRFRV